jgi:hypothetical protein
MEGVGVILVMAAIFGGIGVVAAVFAGYPILAALRAAERLDNVTAPISGALVGLGAALVLWLLDSFKPGIFLMAGVIGAVCGAIALRIANMIAMRPNTSLERSREP